MSTLDSLFNSINNGNKEAIQSFILASRQYVLNTARCFVNDDNDAINIAKKVYEKIIFNDNKICANEDLPKHLYSLISQNAKDYSSNKLLFADLNNISNKLESFEIDDSKYSNYYNNPKVERVLYETINSLPNEEKEIVIRHYFGQESIKDISSSLSISEDCVNKYINKANVLIENVSKPLFIKYKIETADYSKAAIIYSTIKKCISVVNFDVLGITVDKLKDTVVKNDENEKKDLNSFVKDILEDLVQDWFLERLKSIFVSSAVGTSSTIIANATEDVAKNVIIKGTAKKAGLSLAKKVIIGSAVAGIAVTGGAVANNIAKAKNDSNLMETVDSVINAEIEFASIPVFVDFYSSDKSETVDLISAEFAIDKKSINEVELKAIEVTALASGINVEHKESGNSFIVKIVANKESLGRTFINLATSLNLLNENELNELNEIMSYKFDDLNDFLYEKGYIRLFVD